MKINTLYLYIVVYAIITGCNLGGSSSGNNPPPAQPASQGQEEIVDTGTIGVDDDLTTNTSEEELTAEFGVNVDELTVEQSDAQLVTPSSLNIISTSEGETTLTTQTDFNLPADSDFSLAYSRFQPRVDEAATNILSMANSMLCIFGALNFTNHVNQPAYVAAVEESFCFDDSGDSFSEPQRMVISTLVTRQPGSPMNVKGFFNMVMGENEYNHVRIQALIAQGPTPENPFGIFRMSYTGFAIDENDVVSDQKTMYGTLELGLSKDGRVQMVFENGELISEGVFAETTSVAVIEVINGVLGNGKIRTHISGYDDNQTATSMTYDVSYNENHMLQNLRMLQGEQSQSQESCKSRRDFYTYASDYDVFHADSGAHYDLNSNYVIKYQGEKSDNEEFLGFLGYYGVTFWSNRFNEFTDRLTTGDVVRVVNLDDFTESEHTLTVTHGSLDKVTRELINRSDMDGIQVIFPNQSGDIHYAGIGYYSSDDGAFIQTAGAESYGGQGDNIRYPLLENPTTFTGFANTSGDSSESNRLIQTGLGAGNDAASTTISYSIEWDGSQFIGETALKTTTVDRTYEETVDLILYCWTRCLKPGLTQAQYDAYQASPSNDNGTGVNSVYLTFLNFSDSNDPYVYRFNVDDRTLVYLGREDDISDPANAASAGEITLPFVLTNDGPNAPITIEMSIAENQNPQEDTTATVYVFTPSPAPRSDMASLSGLDRPSESVYIPYTHRAAQDANNDLSVAWHNTLHSLEWNGTRMRIEPPISDENNGDRKEVEDFDGDLGFVLVPGAKIGDNEEYITLPHQADQYFAPKDAAECQTLSLDRIPALPEGAFARDADVNPEAIQPESSEPIYVNGEAS